MQQAIPADLRGDPSLAGFRTREDSSREQAADRPHLEFGARQRRQARRRRVNRQDRPRRPGRNFREVAQRTRRRQGRDGRLGTEELPVRSAQRLERHVVQGTVRHDDHARLAPDQLLHGEDELVVQPAGLVFPARRPRVRQQPRKAQDPFLLDRQYQADSAHTVPVDHRHNAGGPAQEVVQEDSAGR